MNNYEKYLDAFVSLFDAEAEVVKHFTQNSTEEWNSASHMALIANLEDAFNVEFEPEEILAFTSFQTGMEVLKHKGIIF